MDPFQIKEEFRAFVIKRDTAPGLEWEEKNMNTALNAQEQIRWLSKDGLFFPPLSCSLSFHNDRSKIHGDTQGGAEPILTPRTFSLDFQMS